MRLLVLQRISLKEWAKPDTRWYDYSEGDDAAGGDIGRCKLYCTTVFYSIVCISIHKYEAETSIEIDSRIGLPS